MVAMSLFLLSSLVSAQSSYNPCDPSLNFAPQTSPNVENWLYTWQDAVPDANHPLGFRVAQIVEDNNPPFCLTVPGAVNRNIQLLIEPIGNSAPSICVKTPQSGTNAVQTGAMAPVCVTGQMRLCFPAESSGTDTQFVIYCDPSCSSTNFYFRVAMSTPRSAYDESSSATSSVDMWCSMIAGTNTSQFPSSTTPTADPSTAKDNQVYGPSSPASRAFLVPAAFFAALAAFFL